MKKTLITISSLALVAVIMGLFFSSCSVSEPSLGPLPVPSFKSAALTPTSDTTAQNLQLINTTTPAGIAYWTIPGVGNYNGDTVNVVVQHAGNYPVTLTIAGQGGAATTTQSVSVPQDNPYTVKASFTYKMLTPTGFDNPQNLELLNTSLHDKSASWSVADAGGKSIGTFTGDTVKITIPFAGSYTVKLTATGNGGLTDTATQAVVIENDNLYGLDPNGIFGILDGSGISATERTWIPNRVIACCVVWDNYDNVMKAMDGAGGSWWQFGTNEIATDGTGRDGYLDDQYTFTVDRHLAFNDNNTVYLDKGGSGWTAALPAPWNSFGGTTSSTDLYNLVPALKPWGSGDFTYSIVIGPAGAKGLGTITVNGVGAHFGLFDKANSGDQVTPTATSIVYDVLRISPKLKDATTGATYDELIIGVQDNGIVWGFRFRSDR